MPSLSSESRSRLLSEVRADQSARWRRGEPMRIEDYLAQHPELADDAEALLQLIGLELLHRQDSGEQPTLDEYLQRFPRHADALRHSWLEVCRGRTPDADAASTAAEPTEAGPSSHRATPTLPGFELQEKLGEGGMGVVYKARDLRLDQPRAVKIIRAAFASREAHERFTREAKAAARLDHSGVVRVYTLGEHDGHLFICMEHLVGGSLHALLRRGPLEVRQAAELVSRVARGVQHAHDNKVLHRDLKPANVLLDAGGAPKVADFGLAKLLDEDDGLTRTGDVMGTPSYMAPEQAEGRLSDIGPATDVWALGAILYECLTGRPPFKGENRSRTMELVKSQPPASPRRLRSEIAPELEAICLHCLEKRPQDRYGSAAELADDLQAWLEGRSPRTRPARGPRRLLRAMRRRPRRTALVALGLLALVTTGLLAYFAHPDRPLWQTQEQLRRGEAVQLLGARGKPRWSRWWLGGEDASAALDPDGTFVVKGWPVTLLELLPDTCGQSHYRIHGEVRHLQTAENGSIGFYFAGTTHHEAKAPVFSYLCVTFNDMTDAKEIHRRLPPNLRGQAPEPKGNRVDLRTCFYAPGKIQHLLNVAVSVASAEICQPAGLAHAGKPGDWRTFRIDVSPEHIRAYWDNKPVGGDTLAQLDRDHRTHLDFDRQIYPDNPALDGLNGRHNLQGGIGLYLDESSAAFRNVRVEPLTDNSKNE